MSYECQLQGERYNETYCNVVEDVKGGVTLGLDRACPMKHAVWCEEDEMPPITAVVGRPCGSQFQEWTLD